MTDSKDKIQKAAEEIAEEVIFVSQKYAHDKKNAKTKRQAEVARAIQSHLEKFRAESE